MEAIWLKYIVVFAMLYSYSRFYKYTCKNKLSDLKRSIINWVHKQTLTIYVAWLALTSSGLNISETKLKVFKHRIFRSWRRRSDMISSQLVRKLLSLKFILNKLHTLIPMCALVIYKSQGIIYSYSIVYFKIYYLPKLPATRSGSN